jgi:hypothetical protein
LYLITAVLGAALLHLYEEFPEFVREDLGTGMVHSQIQEDFRIFTPGMVYVFYAAIGLIPFLKNGAAPMTLWLFLLSGLFWTFLRSYFLIIAICVGIYLLLIPVVRGRSRTAIASLAGVAVTLVTVIGLANAFLPRVLPSFLERMQTVTEAASVPVSEFDSVGWRIRDAGNAIDQVHTTSEVLFGVFAKLYETDGAGVDPSVHVGYVGVYFSYGLLGVIAFSTLIGLTSVNCLAILYRGLKRGSLLSDQWRLMLILSWVAVTLISFFAPTFISGPYLLPVILIMYGLVVFDETARPVLTS